MLVKGSSVGEMLSALQACCRIQVSPMMILFAPSFDHLAEFVELQCLKIPLLDITQEKRRLVTRLTSPLASGMMSLSHAIPSCVS